MLLHMAEATNHTATLAGAQILPAAPPNTLWMSEARGEALFWEITWGIYPICSMVLEY